MIFNNRTEAGNLLATKLTQYQKNQKAVVVAIPRGGLPVGYTIAKYLGLPLEIVLVKKIGHPLHKEFAIGAVSIIGSILSDSSNDVSIEYIEEETERIRDILKQRHKFFYGNKVPLSLKDKIVIVVDDGVATGQTLIASIQLIAKQNPSQIVVALPVGPTSTIDEINQIPEVTKTICLNMPYDFRAVGQFYNEFNQVSDNEALLYMKKANQEVVTK